MFTLLFQSLKVWHGITMKRKVEIIAKKALKGGRKGGIRGQGQEKGKIGGESQGATKRQGESNAGRVPTLQITQEKSSRRTKSFIYLLWNNKRDPTKRQYAGQSGAEVGTCAGQHAHDINSEADKPVANHFRLTGGNKDDMRVTPVIRVKSNNPWVKQQAALGETIHKQV